ncbi:hypothetical protein DL764_000461 [Monosporascus ibericus]|uniref:PKS/mFAS DH domain-containing protein n=1 Tax=Monosporascus ibericus TaxID=155417 RepID=A0A4Q4TTG0_9PEZI|nr:hypothetical protein DL764_000461 [Monosporascus ibericus]
MCTEKGQIPGVYIFKTLNPNIKDKERNVKIVQDLMDWPTDFDVRRASISSFGYGGTNAHVIVESIDSLYPWYEHGEPKAVVKYDYANVDQPLLKVAGDYHLPDLAYTLNCRRSKLAVRGYTVAVPGQEATAFSPYRFSCGSKLGEAGGDQSAIIDLFGSWGIELALTVGHSRGEIAAAYAAGRISGPETILAAYFHGYAVAWAAPVSAMLAVGLGGDEVADYVSEEVAEGVTVACENLPSSVTLSGSSDDIAVVNEILDEIKFISYWCDNLRNRALFNSAMQMLGSSEKYADVNALLEIGPYAALGSPVKQICSANGFEISYVASLTRGADSATALLKMVGEMYNRGLDMNFEYVNSMKTLAPSPTAVTYNKKRNAPHYLPDLPPYQCNYETVYWNQPRTMKELRDFKHPCHDILGHRIFGLSNNVFTWKNMLPRRDMSWFEDHTFGSDVVFPAAGHLSLAIEALLQQLDLEPENADCVEFRDIDIQKALTIPENDDGIEVHTRLEALAGGDWYKFSVESVSNDPWTVHSTGKIQKQLHQQVPGKRWSRSLRRVGFSYGSNFQSMGNVRTNGRDRIAAAGVTVQTKCISIDHESRNIVHPSTIDGCLHVVIAAIHKGLHKEMPWGVVPFEAGEMVVKFPAAGDLNAQGAFKLVKYDAAVPAQLSEPKSRQPYRQIVWEPASIGEEALVTKPEDNANVVFDKIVVDDASGSMLASSSVESYDLIKKALTSGKPVVWVTRGVNQGDSVAGGIPQGSLRVVRSEHVSARIALVDADLQVPLEQLASLVQHQLSSVETKDSGEDVEFWLTEDSKVLVPCIHQNENLNILFHREQPYQSVVASPDEPLKGKIVENETLFETQPSPQQLAPGEVDILVSHAELSKDDLSPHNASEKARFVIGTVVRIGEGVDTSLNGGTVAAYTKAPFTTRLVTKTFAQINADELAAATASTLPHLCKAIDAVLHAANAKAGDHVLPQPAAKTFQDAVSRLGQNFDFRVSEP